MREEEVKTYRVTIAVCGTDMGDVADLVRTFADKIEEGAREEEGSLGMAEGSCSVKVDPPDEETGVEREDIQDVRGAAATNSEVGEQGKDGNPGHAQGEDE